jgi:hypothetical protein
MATVHRPTSSGSSSDELGYLSRLTKRQRREEQQKTKRNVEHLKDADSSSDTEEIPLKPKALPTIPTIQKEHKPGKKLPECKRPSDKNENSHSEVSVKDGNRDIVTDNPSSSVQVDWIMPAPLSPEFSNNPGPAEPSLKDIETEPIQPVQLETALEISDYEDPYKLPYEYERQQKMKWKTAAKKYEAKRARNKKKLELITEEDRFQERIKNWDSPHAIRGETFEEFRKRQEQLIVEQEELHGPGMWEYEYEGKSGRIRHNKRKWRLFSDGTTPYRYATDSSTGSAPSNDGQEKDRRNDDESANMEIDESSEPSMPEEVISDDAPGHDGNEDVKKNPKALPKRPGFKPGEIDIPKLIEDFNVVAGREDCAPENFADGGSGNDDELAGSDEFQATKTDAELLKSYSEKKLFYYTQEFNPDNELHQRLISKWHLRAAELVGTLGVAQFLRGWTKLTANIFSAGLCFMSARYILSWLRARLIKLCVVVHEYNPMPIEPENEDDTIDLRPSSHSIQRLKYSNSMQIRYYRRSYMALPRTTLGTNEPRDLGLLGHIIGDTTTDTIIKANAQLLSHTNVPNLHQFTQSDKDLMQRVEINIQQQHRVNVNRYKIFMNDPVYLDTAEVAFAYIKAELQLKLRPDFS